jgi:MFS family permease
MVVALLVHAGGWLPGTDLADTARNGGLLFYTFHHTGLVMVTPTFHLPADAELVAELPSGYDVDAVVAFAALSGTILILWLLAWSGRRVAERVGGSPLERGLHGTKVALPYALATWGGSWVLTAPVEVPGASPMTLHPSHFASLFWPLALGVIMGFVGGVRSAGESTWTSDWWETDRWNRRIRGALVGGWRMSWVAVALCGVALAGLALARFSDTRSYLDEVFSGGAVAGLSLLALNALVVPNMVLWLLIPAMGGCLQAGGNTAHPYCFLSYGAYPGHPTGGIPVNLQGFPNLGPAPPVFLLFALIPLVAVVWGGVAAARSAEVRSASEAMGVGLLAGLVFAGILGLSLTLAVITATFKGPFAYPATGFFRFGPNPVHGIQLALVWGLLGGAAGGWLGFVRMRTSKLTVGGGPGARDDGSRARTDLGTA